MESVLILVVALAVLIGGISFFQQAATSRSVGQTARAMAGMTEQARELFRCDRTFGNRFIEDILISARVATATMIDERDYEADPSVHRFGFGVDGNAIAPVPREGAIRHAWGGTIEAYGGTDWMSLRLNELPRAACMRLATVNEGGSGPMGQGVFALNINGALVLPTAGPVTAATIAAHCGAPGFLEIGYAKNASNAHAVAERIEAVNLSPETPDEGGEDGSSSDEEGDDPTEETPGEGDDDQSLADWDGSGVPPGVSPPSHVYSSDVWPENWGTTAGWGETLVSDWLDTGENDPLTGGMEFEIIGNVGGC